MLPAAVLPSPGKIQFRATMFLTSFNNVQDIVWYNHHWVEDQKILQLGSKNKYLRIKNIVRIKKKCDNNSNVDLWLINVAPSLFAPK